MATILNKISTGETYKSIQSKLDTLPKANESDEIKQKAKDLQSLIQKVEQEGKNLLEYGQKLAAGEKENLDDREVATSGPGEKKKESEAAPDVDPLDQAFEAQHQEAEEDSEEDGEGEIDGDANAVLK